MENKPRKLQYIEKQLQNSFLELDNDCKYQLSIPYLKAIAETKVALQEVAKYLKLIYLEKNYHYLSEVANVLKCAQRICTLSLDLDSPGVYFLKIIIKEYGFFCLKEICENHKWIIPSSLTSPNMVRFILLYFVF